MELILVVLLVLHVLLTGFYVWDWYRDYGRLQETIIRLVLCLFLPFVGFLFCKLVDFFLEKAPELQMDQLYLGNGEILDDLNLLRPVNRNEEIDKAPAVDTLRTGEYGYRRRMIMDTLKEEDTVDYLSVLKEALANEDAETSHYASTVIMDLQKRVQTTLLEKQRAYQQNPQDLERQEELERELYRVIESGVYDEHNLPRFYAQYEEISDVLLAQQNPQGVWLHHRVAVDLRKGNLVEAKEIVLRYVDLWPGDEDAVVDFIQVCIRLKDRETLDHFLVQLKEMPVILTRKSLQYIRFLREKETRS